MLPVPGTEILLSKTEFTVGEWKLYLRAEGYPEWQQPDPKEFTQTDEHPVVKVSWNDAMKFCEWLSKVSGKHWRLPKETEWEAAVGKMKYPWGDYYPPKKEDGNYAILADGKDDPAKVGVDGVKGTAPVGSFRANALGFYDLGGNVWEWMQDGYDEKDPKANRRYRGGSWYDPASFCTVVYRFGNGSPTHSSYNFGGFRVALSSVR
jgi:formylglycine-generating enzyme required for sulfatase activity